jgi:hypothetical protein
MLSPARIASQNPHIAFARQTLTVAHVIRRGRNGIVPTVVTGTDLFDRTPTDTSWRPLANSDTSNLWSLAAERKHSS